MTESKSNLESCKAFMANVETGVIEGEEVKKIVLRLIRECWDDLARSSHDEAKMTKDKLDIRRIEELTWDPPELSFRIARHGGTVNGSSREEVHSWSLNLNLATRSRDTKIAQRQVRPRQAPLDVKPIASSLASAIVNHEFHRGLAWKNIDCVQVSIGSLIPGEGPAQTVKGRRDRLHKELTELLAKDGWHPTRKMRWIYTREVKPTERTSEDEQENGE